MKSCIDCKYFEILDEVCINVESPNYADYLPISYYGCSYYEDNDEE